MNQTSRRCVVSMVALALSLGACELGTFEDDEALDVIAAPLGTIQAEAFIAGGEGVGYHDTSSKNAGGALRPGEGVDIERNAGGYNVGWTEAGEWLAYDVAVPAAGRYAIAVRVASAYADARSFRFEVRGATIASFTLTGGAGLYAWKTLTVDDVALAAGTTRMRLVFDSAKLNVDAFSVTAADVEPPPPAPTALVVGGAYGSNADPTPVEDRAEAVFGSSRTYYGPTGQAGAIARIKANEAAGRRVSHISFKLPHAWAAMATGAGLSETGLTDAAFAANPRWFAEVIDAMVDHGGSWFDYFNTNLNSTATWAMTAGSAREKGFIEALVAADR